MESVLLAEHVVINKIYVIRGQKVMIDRDLAQLYGVQTRRLNEMVKRNKKRFPPDFMFQLSDQESKSLMSHFATSSWGGTRKFPYVFTENGVAMLSSVLNTDRAIEVNIEIMRIFTKVRQSLIDNTELRLAIEEIRKKAENNSKNIEVVFKYLDELLEKKEDPKRTRIGFKP